MHRPYQSYSENDELNIRKWAKVKEQYEKIKDKSGKLRKCLSPDPDSETLRREKSVKCVCDKQTNKNKRKQKKTN